MSPSPVLADYGQERKKTEDSSFRELPSKKEYPVEDEKKAVKKLLRRTACIYVRPYGTQYAESEPYKGFICGFIREEYREYDQIYDERKDTACEVSLIKTHS